MAVSPETPGGQPAYLVDASVYIFRAWYSRPDRFADPAGNPTNAVYGFARFLCELLEQTQAGHVAVAFDESLTTSFRNEIYPDYKANREPAPEELKRQFAWCQDLGRALGLSVCADSYYEADDLIATLAGQCRSRQQSVCVVTGDKDLAQLLVDDDHWWDFSRRRRLDRRGVFEHFGVHPHQMADFLALTGDPVDNIPGVPGVGPKTASALLARFGSLDALYERLDEIAWLKIRGAKTLAAKLRQHEPAARLARRLTGLHCEVPLLTEIGELERTGGDADALDALLDSLGFGRPLRERLHRLRNL
ncbi:MULTISPECIES: 5'-3' exonuclease H3TH domain-containing protein [unclassified Wenzhouxiangella]|uniref:5'-3' exonuclease n=1 Tax=unclassified Wenzhouxiangella TaxID=2613841 RepID=UPI000E32742E|nr:MULTISPECIES: 5'-3' exonuclease H3TH domain-containing protein [unclassified Wenzhouxiangella]RFF28409.1 exodeoxyribonuclease IX [Wenzhouxiangella sp. 15181]RFP69926.1 exodeoxyribonuclease IX [Wenzhouxiangella sp. 15190]